MDSQRRCEATIHYDHFTKQCNKPKHHREAHTFSGWREMDSRSAPDREVARTVVWIDYRWYSK